MADSSSPEYDRMVHLLDEIQAFKVDERFPVELATAG
jgi:hypothetical protein